MKKFILAPAVAVVAGSIAFAGTPAFAAPADNMAECADSTLSIPEPCVLSIYDDQITTSGVEVKVAGLPEGTTITDVSAVNSEDGDLTIKPGVIQDSSFKVYGVEGTTGDSGTKNPNGDYPVVLTLSDGQTVEAGVIRYIDKDQQATGDPEFKVSPEVQVDTFRIGGMLVTYKNLEAKKDFSYTLTNETTGKSSTGTFRSEPNSEQGGSFWAKVEGADKKSDKELAGNYTLTIVDPSGNKLEPALKFKVVSGLPDVTPPPSEEKPEPKPQPTEEAAKYALKVSPKEITPADFANKDKGVELVVTGLKPNEKFTYSVTKLDGDNVESLDKEVTADADGNWTHTVYGIKGDEGLAGFLGKYKVTVKSEAGELSDTFTVTNTPGKKGDKKDDAKAGDNNSSDDKSSNTLPRTGAELSGLVAGGVLLTVGAATVLVTRRRTK